jgi:hypothetical protein
MNKASCNTAMFTHSLNNSTEVRYSQMMAHLKRRHIRKTNIVSLKIIDVSQKS